MSRSRKGRGGRTGGLVKQAAAVVIIGSMIIGFFGIPSRPDADGITEMLKSKSETVDTWMQNCVPKVVSDFDFSRCSLISNVGGGSDSSKSAPVSKADVEKAEAALTSLSEGAKGGISYDRDDWNHWVTAPSSSSCWNVREAVLYAESDKSAVVLKDKDGKEVSSVSKACSITAGKWSDPYTGKTFTDPKKLDIDHMVPLSYTAQMGGQAWDSKKKEKYANDMSYSNHLIAVEAGANRSKSDQGPASWMPSNSKFHCDYAVSWINVSKNYDLEIAKADSEKLRKVLASC